MQTNIIWTGIEYNSVENCLINITGRGTTIRSVITGLYDNKIYIIEYEIHTNAHWETTLVEIYARHSNREQQIILSSNTNGDWLMNGEKNPAFTGCIDVDIPLTPFTNTLPVNRLHLKDNEEKQINVIYLDMLEWNVRTVQQRYIKRSANIYHYENIPNDFEADIEIDEHGFIKNYPSLFKRSAALSSSYSC